MPNLQNLLQDDIRHRNRLSNIKEKVIKDSFTEFFFFLHLEKDHSQIIFLLFDVKELFTTGKNSLKRSVPLQKVPLQMHLVEKRESQQNNKNFRDLFKTYSKIYDGTFMQK